MKAPSAYWGGRAPGSAGQGAKRAGFTPGSAGQGAKRAGFAPGSAGQGAKRAVAAHRILNRSDSNNFFMIRLNGNSIYFATGGIYSQHSYKQVCLVADPNGLTGVDVDTVPGVEDKFALYIGGAVVTCPIDSTTYDTSFDMNALGD